MQGIESPLLAYLGRAKCSLIPNCIPCTQGCPRGLLFPLRALLSSFRATLPRDFYDPPPPFTPASRLCRNSGNNSWNTCLLSQFYSYNDTNFFLFFSRFCYGMLDIFLIKTTFVLFAESLFVERGNFKEGGGRGTFVCFQYFIRMIII